ncbi:hypothetical protein VNI00_010429 [Paramarasmius palmivorus]|uniref:Uncharacterized protein n=1 Tax=Paramarasmius palmivorus TaxID=297713 RepID=A0AAW0ARJ2_9AGAR
MDCSSGYGLVYAIYRNSTVKEMVKGHITARFGSILASIMASETVPKEVAPYISVLRVIDLPLSTFSVMYFVYGIYVLIFGTYLYMMRNHEQKYDNTSVANRLYLRLAVVLFVLSTIFVADFTAMRVQDSELFFNAAKARDYRTLYRYLTSANKERMALL